MARIIAIAGKGGVGKTTLSAFLIKRLVKTGGPVLAVDADPNTNLNVALGMEYSKTVADIREETKTAPASGFSRSDFFEMRLQEIISEGAGVDLLVMGRPEGPGCYCAVNNILREALLRLSKNYRYIVIDNEAGMEHLSRRTAAAIDLLLLISDPTAVGVQSAINAFSTAKNAGLKVSDVSLLINKSKGVLAEEKLKSIKDAGLNMAGYAPFQEDIEKNSEGGGPVLALDKDMGMDNILKETQWRE
ncbi:MAG: AAA family ATPase [Candidatus Omnitrophota bacterium]